MASMTKVLLLRAPKEGSDQDPYKELFAESGLDETSFSPLSFEFFNLEKLYSHLIKPNDYAGLVFTSARTVQAVHNCLQEFSTFQEWKEGLQKDWATLPSYSVGTSTALAVRDLGLTPLGEESGSATNLVKVIKEGISPGCKPLLIPRGEMAREELTIGLQAAGICFEVDVVYQTICNPSLEESITKYFEAGEPDVIVFFSPSGVQFSADILKKVRPGNLKFVSIGPTTTSAMVEHGYKVAATSAKPNAQTLLKTILDITDKVS
ncbi:uroporphyrinogen-III synthase-like [Asterias amurensis]|uniref:uroporphyrinogen-III synthase-like n=1 Tax=Asterias amurensis TaxID=7602 RepID=UPI003AB51D42